MIPNFERVIRGFHPEFVKPDGRGECPYCHSPDTEFDSLDLIDTYYGETELCSAWCNDCNRDFILTIHHPQRWISDFYSYRVDTVLNKKLMSW